VELVRVGEFQTGSCTLQLMAAIEPLECGQELTAKNTAEPRLRVTKLSPRPRSMEKGNSLVCSIRNSQSQTDLHRIGQVPLLTQTTDPARYLPLDSGNRW